MAMAIERSPYFFIGAWQICYLFDGDNSVGLFAVIVFVSVVIVTQLAWWKRLGRNNGCCETRGL